MKNPCSGRVLNLRVSDCGPNLRCRKTGCKGYTSLRWDLTACSFTAIGGNPAVGWINLWVGQPVDTAN